MTDRDHGDSMTGFRGIRSQVQKCRCYDLLGDLKGMAIMPASADDQIVQILVPVKLKKAIKRRALEREETVRTLVLKALRDSGLHVDETELRARRRGNQK